MTQHTLPESTLGPRVFPGFALLHPMVVGEVEGLSDAQLDFSSDKWAWANWSIRTQVRHIANFLPGWLIRRWGPQLFPQGYGELGDMAEYAKSPHGWWLDEEKFPDMPSVLKKVKDGLDLAHYILARETLGSMRQKEEPRPDTPPHWSQFMKAHPAGVRWHPTEANFTYITLEATFRHLYYEVITHMYNIQRLKRAQGLEAAIDLPFEGYWALPDWDRSEA